MGLLSIIPYRRRQLLASHIKRCCRWEFWPMTVFYIPVVAYIVWLVFRHRGMTFTAVNPGLPGSGFIGENKSLSLLQLQQHCPEYTATTIVIPADLDEASKLLKCQQFMAEEGIDFPVVLKPDFGQRGVDVEIVPNNRALAQYLNKAVFDTVLQEYIDGVEFGVFYVREPEQPKGHIFSLTHKCFPALIGDGIHTIETLIFQHSRLQYMAAFLLNAFPERMYEVPAKGEKVKLINLGSHCQGALFLEGEQYHSAELASAIDHASHQIEEFYFGRYDVRAASIEAFKQGDIRIIEVNGVTSESTNMYDPSYSVFNAYRILCKQWKKAFEIGEKNIQRGYQSMSIGDLISKVRSMNMGNS